MNKGNIHHKSFQVHSISSKVRIYKTHLGRIMKGSMNLPFQINITTIVKVQ